MPAPRGVFALLVSMLVAGATMAATMPPSRPAALATWPSSGGIVLAEVLTGGASASDEYVEIANSGPAEADLDGCELVYVTASGSTITRKAVFSTSLRLAPGQHLLVANAAGTYGPLADATYTGGLAADGGAIALRRLDGTVVDAMGWGTAANAFVEGAAAPAPPAKSSLERLPGGPAGNTLDTNDNLSDWFIQPNPIPQSLASLPAPGPTPGPSVSPSPPIPPTETEAPTAAATATNSPAPEGSSESRPSTVPSERPTSTPGPTSTPAPTSTSIPTGSVAPTTMPSPTAAQSASAGPSAVPTPGSAASSSASDPASDVISIAAARARSIGARVHVAGVATAETGAVGAADLCAIQDSTGGIFVRLPAATGGPKIGQRVDVEGVLAAPYGQLEIRNVGRIALGSAGPEPLPSGLGLAAVGEDSEGSLVTVSGTVASITADGGRLTLAVGDGTTSIRVLADPPAGLSRDDATRGDVVSATGIVGQRATATGRLDGYRLWLRRGDDLVVREAASTASPTPLPTASAAHRNLVSALATRGAAVDVVATVTATAGLVEIGGSTVVVDDGTAAVAVILPDATAAPRVGMSVRVVGKVGRWEGGPTVLASEVTSLGQMGAVAPRSITSSLDGSLEWHLVTVCGRIDKVVRAGSRWRADLTVDGHPVVVLGEPAAGIAISTSDAGRLVVVAGIVRRSTSDSSVFQLLPRSRIDFRLGPAPAAFGAARTGSSNRPGSGSGGAGDAGGGVATTVGIGSLANLVGRSVTVAGLVTETDGATATIDDGTGRVRVGGAAAAAVIEMLEPGDAIEVSGIVRRDSAGLFLEADPASIVDLPGDLSSATASPASTGGLADLLAGPASELPGSSQAGSASIRRAVAAAPLPGAAATLAGFLAVLAVAAGLAALGNRRRIGRPVLRMPAGVAARLAHFDSRRHRFGRRDRP